MILKEELGNRSKPFQFRTPKPKIMSFKVPLPLSTPVYPSIPLFVSFCLLERPKLGKLLFFVSHFSLFLFLVSVTLHDDN